MATPTHFFLYACHSRRAYSWILPCPEGMNLQFPDHSAVGSLPAPLIWLATQILHVTHGATLRGPRLEQMVACKFYDGEKWGFSGGEMKNNVMPMEHVLQLQQTTSREKRTWP